MADTTYTSLIHLTKQSLRKGDLATAKKVAQYAVAQYPEELEGWLLLGGLTKPENSLVYLNKARALSPEDARVKAALAWAHQQIGQPTPMPHQAKSPPSIPKPQPGTFKLTPQPVTEARGLVWVWALIFILFLSLVFLGMGTFRLDPIWASSHFRFMSAADLSKPTLTATPGFITQIAEEPLPSPTPSPTQTPTPTATPTVIPRLYGCSMEIRFISGPLAPSKTTFSMLDESYFYDKGDKFDEGKNTGIFYSDQHYVILHSGYQGGTITAPLEVEFIRKYLEEWGNEEPEYIEAKIEDLIGSQIVWICDGQIVLATRLTDVVRLSHQASTRLWLEPQNIFEIIQDREGVPAEWIRGIEPSDAPAIYLGFCGWGPPNIRVGRSIYYRYILRFEIFE
jgi:hypothetical protein